MRKLTYYVASTLDGFIAHEDGSYDGFPWDEQYGADLLARFPETFPSHVRPDGSAPADNKWFDVVLMGRKTYEVGLDLDVTSPYPTLEQYVFSRTMRVSPDPQVDLVRDDAIDVVRRLKAEAGKRIWLCGGADLASALFGADMIDELIVKLNPVLFGSGIPLFHGDVERVPLNLKEHKIYPSGHALLHYRVGGQAPRTGSEEAQE